MRGNKYTDRLFSTVSWFIVVALIYSMVMLWVDPPSGAGPFARLLGIFGAQIFYSVLYGGEGLLLAYSKFFKKRKLRKVVLLITFLTGIFTLCLSFTILGPNIALIDNLMISVSAAGCWLYWTFKTEYVTDDEFNAHRMSRED